MKTFCEKLSLLISQREAEVMKADVGMVNWWLSWARGPAKLDMGWSSDTKKAVIDVLECVRDDIQGAIASRLEDSCCSETT